MLGKPFWWLFAGTLVNRLGYAVVPFLTLYLVHERAMAPAAAGAIVTTFGLGSLLSQPLGGWLADRFGRRPVLAGSMLSTGAAYLALGAARAPVATAVCAFFAGLATDAYRPAVAAMVSDLVSPPLRQRAYGLLYWAINMGVGVAALLGGALAEREFGLLFVIDAVTCAGFAAIALIALPETKPDTKPETKPDGSAETKPGLASMMVVARDSRLIVLTVSTFLIALVSLQWVITLPLQMRADGLPPAAYGIVAAVNPAVIIVTQPLIARIPLSPQRMYSLGGVLTGLGFGLTGFAGSVTGYAATVVVWTLGEILFNASAPVIVASLAPVQARARYQGIWGMAFGIAMFASPLAGTWTWQSVGGGAVWGASAVIAVAAVVLARGITRGIMREPARI